MKTLTEKLELLASQCSTKEHYKESLFVLSHHCGLIQSARHSNEPTKQLGLLHDLYAMARQYSLDTRDKTMYSITTDIAYCTGQEVVLPLFDPITLHYTAANAILHIEGQKNRLKTFQDT